MQISNQIQVTFEDLIKLLKQLGFTEFSTTGVQVVFEYPISGFLIVLPPHQLADFVPMRHLVGIRSQLDEIGLISPAAFDGW
jgi:predicted RNA binding protein YcfA (HicA-like mRNA interferase family)